MDDMVLSVDCAVAAAGPYGFSINLNDGKTESVVVFAGLGKAVRELVPESGACWRTVRCETSIRTTHCGSTQALGSHAGQQESCFPR